jgi:ribosomal protein L18E
MTGVSTALALFAVVAVAAWLYSRRFSRGIVRSDERAAALKAIAERALATLRDAGHRPAKVMTTWTHRNPALKIVMRTEAELTRLQTAPLSAAVAAQVAAAIRADARFGPGRGAYRPEDALILVQLSEAP